MLYIILCLPSIEGGNKSLDWGPDTTNSHEVGDAPGFGFNLLTGLIRE